MSVAAAFDIPFSDVREDAYSALKDVAFYGIFVQSVSLLFLLRLYNLIVQFVPNLNDVEKL